MRGMTSPLNHPSIPGRYTGVFETDTGDGDLAKTVFAGYAADSSEEKEDLLGINAM